MAHSLCVHRCTILNTWLSAEEPVSDEPQAVAPIPKAVPGSATALGVCDTLWPAVWKMTSVHPWRAHSFPSHTQAEPPHCSHLPAPPQPPSLPHAALAQRLPLPGMGHTLGPPGTKASPWGCSLLSDEIRQGTADPWVPQLCPFNWTWHQHWGLTLVPQYLVWEEQSF